MEIYCKGLPQDAHEIIDFADYVFSKSSVPHDFTTLLPKLYADGRQTQHFHYLVKEDGKIMAMVCVMPVTIRTGESVLKAACIGTVSVHPRARGKGYMKKLMTAALADMKEQGFYYSMLGGQRQRYEYFGYQQAGVQLKFTLTATNIKHKYQGINTEHLTFQSMENRMELLDKAYDLHQRLPVAAVRSREDFLYILKSWASQPYAVLSNGDFAGYVCLSKNAGGTTIREIELTDGKQLPAVCKALFESQKLTQAEIFLPIYDKEKTLLLSQVCEDISIGAEHSYCIFNYEETIRVLLSYKAQNTKLQDGSFIFNITDYGTIKIEVQNQRVTVESISEKDSFAPLLTLTRLEATAVLFSHCSVYFDMVDKTLPDCVKNWFPLPLYTPPLDGC